MMYFIKENDVILVSDTKSVNFDPLANTEHAATYLAWLEAGNTPEPWPTEETE
jgi:hypothetical protein